MFYGRLVLPPLLLLLLAMAVPSVHGACILRHNFTPDWCYPRYDSCSSVDLVRFDSDTGSCMCGQTKMTVKPSLTPHCKKYLNAAVDFFCQAYDHTDTLSMCYTCEDGYVALNPTQRGRFNYSSTCVPRIANCDNHTDNGQCAACSPDYRLSNDKNSCTKYTDLCTSRDNSGTCTSCATGYFLQPQYWVCLTDMPGCIEYHTIYSGCTVCSTGYFQNTLGPNCTKLIDRCITYNADGSCTVCSTGNTPTNDRLACVTIIPECSSHNADGTCRECDSGFSLSSNRKSCVLCTLEGCSRCDTANVCAQCADGYNFTTNHTACATCGIQNCSSCDRNEFCAQCGWVRRVRLGLLFHLCGYGLQALRCQRRGLCRVLHPPKQK
ncbi:Giardia variant-specific surface protein [Angomonas deanei]|uniref:Uncharacterized protein n=1 Tax=Angomonas deanei TaxID=59799 RepID=A0A7G2C741_9TRYP|nr:Giardia variant-specific surface protein [Angomonas deanei]CAD2213772.1 hypothetical protein, conserved [Angomonas deanei]|eukprot:EPY17025.1 Giardia variant-specific surface protein [Angomonas deanei]